MKELSKQFYMWSIFGSMGLSIFTMIVAVILLAAAGEDPPPAIASVAIGMICMMYPVMIYGAVIMYVLIYKLWVPLQDSFVRTTPGKAVGFMFIPFFNIYWFFQVFWGWAVDYNQYIITKGVRDARDVNEGFALTLCILMLCSMIPFLGILIGLVCIVMMAFFFSQAIDGANAVIRHRLASSETLQP